MPSNKRQGKTARRSKRRTASGPKLYSLAPQARRANLAYNSAFQITESAANLGGFRVYRLNSIYDPDLTGIGSSAAGYAQYMTMFSAYRVHSVRVRLQGYYTVQTGGDPGGHCGMVPILNQTVMPSNPSNWITMPGARFKTVISVTNGGTNRIDTTVTYNIARLLRVTKQQFRTDFDYAAVAGTNPIKPCNLAICVRSPYGTSAGIFYGNVTIGYEVEFFNPLPLTAN